MVKNNTANEIKYNFYTCIDNLVGSDHRPVVLSLSIKQQQPVLQQTEETGEELEQVAHKLRYLMDYKALCKYTSLNL